MEQSSEISALAPELRFSSLLLRAGRDANLQAYKDLQRVGGLVHYRTVSGRRGQWETVDGLPCLMFASNDYLGLRWDRRTAQASAEAVEVLGSGSAGSRLMAGNAPYHRELEVRLAQITGFEEACVFTTGYQANLGAISALLQGGDVAFCDSGVHASLIDGCRLAGAQIRQFRRQRLGRLTKEIVEAERQRSSDEPVRAVLTDAIYSMEGDILDFDALAAALTSANALLHVDEAHSLGVLGPNGGGLVASCPGRLRADFVTGTLSKSFASCGGFVAGPRELVDMIRVRARSLLFSTAGTPGALAAALEAIRISIEEPERRSRVLGNADRLRARLSREGLDIGDGRSQIIPVYVRDTAKTIALARMLYERGVCVGVAVHPAVPRRDALIRLSVTAAHEEDDIDRCATIVAESFAAVSGEAVAA